MNTNDKVDPKDIGVPNINFSIFEDTKSEKAKKYKQQRIERGFDDSETWNLDYTFACFMLPRLKRFREVTIGTPHQFESHQEWLDILDLMIEGLEIQVKDDYFLDKGKEDKVQTAINLIAEYWFDLWW